MSYPLSTSTSSSAWGPGYIPSSIGYTDRIQEQWSREFDPTRLHKNEISGGPMTKSYENLVRNIFRPEQAEGYGGGGPILPPSFAPPSGQQGLNVGQRILGVDNRPKISAAAMRRVESQLGRDALDDSNDDQLWKSPLDEIYAELGISNIAMNDRPSLFPVYTPKSSTEYFSTVTANPSSIPSHRSSALGTYRLGAPSSLRPISSSSSSTIGWDSLEGDKKGFGNWRNTDRQMLFDCSSSQSPFSSHLYGGGSVRRQDSRIVGSNFVQLTQRPKDRFLEKIDKTLADVRSEPRYYRS
ncbi:hypothetical protein Mgra_00000888 [Meloidogyne graminicola]|uniref:Uncharacterized protein n=1 Tax=Meloidogyne graminicola TaxID=189291 RepID=A0A8T0A2F0_9BILA|nr:hypothetical protein Mgra_00000888 [Meloidogyne graminicola]